jgi:predicted nucleic acid-binding protein
MPLLTFLVDTNVVSGQMRRDPAILQWLEAHRDQVAISTLTIAEIRRGIELKPDSKAKRDLEREFKFLMQDYSDAIWFFDEAAAMEWGRLMAELRNRPVPYEDSLIAAIARAMNAKMVTRNVRHFPGVAAVDPWSGLEYPSVQPSS